ncbi:MAG: DUF1800 family protein [Thermomicrobiales bacterium]
MRDGERVAELLLAHPALPRFVATKLVRRFVADEPPPGLVAAVAEVFARTGGDVKAMLRAMFRALSFRAAPPKFKRPLAFVAVALRQLGAATMGGSRRSICLDRWGSRCSGGRRRMGFPTGRGVERRCWRGGDLRWHWRGMGLRGRGLDWGTLERAAGAGEPGAWLDRVGGVAVGRGD